MKKNDEILALGESPNRRNGRSDWIEFGVWSAFALVIRLVGLDRQSLWLDEAAIYNQISADSVGAVVRAVEGHIGPFYHVLLYGFCGLAGTSEWALRFPSALFGALCVGMLFFFALRLFDRPTARAAALLLAVSPLHIWYSQEARMYALWVLLGVASAHAFWVAVQSNRRRDWALMAVLAGAALWTYLNSVFLFAAFGLFLLLEGRRRFDRWLPFTLSFLFVGVGFMPRVLAFLNKTEMGIGSVRPTGLSDLAFALYSFAVGTSLGPPVTEIRQLRASLGNGAILRLFETDGPALVAAGLLLAVLLAIMAVWAWRERKQPVLRLAVLLAVVPLGLTYLAALLLPSVPFNLRYALVGLPFFWLLAAGAFVRLPRRVAFGVALGMMLVLGWSLVNHYSQDRYAKVDMRAAVKYLSDTAQPGDRPLIFYEHAQVLLRYYDPEGHFAVAAVGLSASPEELLAACGNHTRVRILETVRVQQYRPGLVARVRAGLAAHYRPCGSMPFNKAELDDYCLNNEQSAPSEDEERK